MHSAPRGHRLTSGVGVADITARLRNHAEAAVRYQRRPVWALFDNSLARHGQRNDEIDLMSGLGFADNDAAFGLLRYGTADRETDIVVGVND
jgi:hypothetical protein